MAKALDINALIETLDLQIPEPTAAFDDFGKEVEYDFFTKEEEFDTMDVHASKHVSNDPSELSFIDLLKSEAQKLTDQGLETWMADMEESPMSMGF